MRPPGEQSHHKPVCLPIMNDWLPLDGEMSERIRSFDWASHPLGSPHTWPQSLKIVIRIMLTSRYAMWMGWGPEFYFFCNDAYLPTVGIKRDWVLGTSARKVWEEIWPDIGPRAESVVQTGKATWDESLLLFLERSGYPEETYHTFSYSPVPGDSGATGGMLCVVTEDTERVIGERRLTVLRELAADLASINLEQELYEVIQGRLDVSAHDLPFTLLYLFDPTETQAKLVCSTGFKAGHALALSTIEVSSAGCVWPLQRILRLEELSIVHDLSTNLATIPTGPWNIPPRQAVIFPLVQQGHERPAGCLIAGINPYRPFDTAYRGFISLLAGQMSAGLSNVRIYEEERKRAEALAELDRAKTTFFSNVSHEFRTPLTLMLGPVEDLLARSHTDLAPSAKDQLEVVNRNGRRLLRLVNTLLDFSRIEAGRVQAVFEPTDLAVFTTELASVFRSATERAGLRLIVDCLPLTEPVYVDRDMWEKIVLNLISNAFKFTFDGEIQVRLQQVGDQAELRVRDTGVGIPAEEMPRLFERFHRIQNMRSRTHEGSGIGLALVQELVKLHGGSVTAQSQVGEGSVFIVTVPLGKAHLPSDRMGTSRSLASTAMGAGPFVEEALRWLPEGCNDQSTPDEELPRSHELVPIPCPSGTLMSDRPSVLIADDNADMCQYIARLLSERYHVEAAADGEAALEAARTRRPDLVLSDVMMPRLDGFGLVRALRADPTTQTIPVILLSARAGEESRVEGLEQGADDYLIKPFSARELMARVSAHLEMARVRQEAVEMVQRKQEQLIQASKLASIGQLATGVAHELNNPLNNIGLFIGNILDSIRIGNGDPQAFVHSLQQAQGQVRKAAVIINHLRTFGRMSPPVRQLVSINHVLRQAHALLQAEFRTQVIEVTFDLAEEEPEVLGDAIQLEQVFLNLLTNARDALHQAATKRIVVLSTKKGETVEVVIRDNGTGIPPEIQSRIFDPFFTTKDVGKGTGLGLSISYGIINEHQGEIIVKSDPGQGATFIITLPLVAPSV